LLATPRACHGPHGRRQRHEPGSARNLKCPWKKVRS
jgi:hypothetical protein